MSYLFCKAIRWPAGTYGIPKPASGCPWAEDFTWEEGWLSQDTNGKNSSNLRSAEFHLDGEVDSTKVLRSFCLKMGTVNDYLRPKWPPGQYCLYKKRRCPNGLPNKGSVSWDDENINNSNNKSGTLPGGIYEQDTEIRFCCKTNGSKTVPILLPSKTPFFLLAYASAKCQMVKWAVANLEWIHFDTEHDDNKDKGSSPYPYDAGKRHPTIYYCYYRGCNYTLTGANGSFHSPNYPGKYPDGQCCSWRITVSTGRQVHLKFANFSLQWELNTDSLSIYDGENETGQVLGEYYGRYPPPKEGISSSSNHMFIIFKSDDRDSYTGFSAFYCEDRCLEGTTSMTTQMPEMPSSPNSITPKTSRTSEKATPSREPTPTTEEPSDKIGGKGSREQTKGKGPDVVAVVVPVVVLILLVALLLAGLFYCKRRKTKKKNQELLNEVFYSRTSGEARMTVDNPCYDRGVYRGLSVENISGNLDSGLTIANKECTTQENELYTAVKEMDSGFTIANKGCTTEENELYTEIDEMDTVGRKEVFDQQQTENPTHETGDGVCSSLSVENISGNLDSGFTIANKGCTTEENELYTEVEEMDNIGRKEAFDQQQTENPTCETADGVYSGLRVESISGGLYSGLTIANKECTTQENELYTAVKEMDSGFAIANNGCTREENELYTEFDEMDNVGTKEVVDQQQTENPTYETIDGDAVFNPIYDLSSM